MRALIGILLTMLVPTTTLAHGTADNHLQIMVVDNRIKMNIVVDMRVLEMADGDNDGYAGLDELATHSGDIKDWANQALRITDGQGSAGQVVFADLTSDLDIADAYDGRVDHARLLQTVRFPAELRELRLDLRQLVERVPELRVTLIDAATGKRYRLRTPGRVHEILLPGRSPLN